MATAERLSNAAARYQRARQRARRYGRTVNGRKMRDRLEAQASAAYRQELTRIFGKTRAAKFI